MTNPTFELHELAPRSSDVCVLIPVINEGHRILDQLERMRSIPGLPDVVVTDGGSTDGSMDLPRLEARGVRALLVKQTEGKLGTQLRIGFGYGLDQGYDGFVTLDGNGKDGIEAIPSFIDALEQGYDFVQGSRFIPGGRAVNTPWIRWWAIRALHAPIVSYAAGFRYTDTTNGFRAYSGRLLQHPEVQPFRDMFQKYEILWYLAARAAQVGLKVGELPVMRVYPAHGPTPTRIRLPQTITILRDLADLAGGRFNPPAPRTP